MLLETERKMSKEINNMIENNETKASTAAHNELQNKSLTFKACINWFIILHFL